MTTTKSKGAKPAPSAEASHAASIAAQLAELEAMTTAELQEKWHKVFGEAARSRNKGYLHKRLAYRLQEIAEGGLSAKALDRIEELADKAPIRRRARPGAAHVVQTIGDDPNAPAARDARLPPAGTVLRPKYKGREFAITVLEQGFELEGQGHFKSLSAAAKAATGQVMNGYLWCGLLAKDAKNGGSK
jgi:hypothetical protein